ncbi:MAG: cation:proton antiporter [Gemmatimonadales bacterium]
MQWLTLAFTCIAMALFQRLTRTGPLEARATLALGFLVIAAHLGGVLAQRLRLPRITGFLVIGFAVGPAWLGLVRPDEVQALSAIATGALALIAFGAGSELRLAALREDRVAILRIAAGAIALPFAAVALIVLTVSPWFPLTAHQPFRDAAVVALVLGAMAAVSSPAITWALITDVGARGPMSRTILGVTVVQSVAAVLLLVLVLALAQPLASVGSVRPGISGIAFLPLAGSLAAGVFLGVAIAQYVKVIGRYMALVLVAVAFIVVQGVRLVGLEAVLIALAAGCTIVNASPTEGGGGGSERLRTELQRCALPVYIVFFGLAGADLQLGALGELWPWVLLLVGLRITSLRVGLRWAGRHPAVSAKLATHGWLGLVSQGGLAVTLAAVLRRAFPEWNVSLESLLVAMIGVHQLAGPICFQWALRITGEVPEGAHVAQDVDAPQEGRGEGGDTALIAGSSGV